MKINKMIGLFVCLLTIYQTAAQAPYIPKSGLTNVVNGKTGEDASIFYEQQLESESSDFKNIKNPNKCQEKAARKYLKCDWTSPYRNIDGTCNNPRHPFYGATGECFLRFLPASYEGRSGTRQSVEKASLPEVRTLSLNIFTDFFKPALKNVSMMFTVFGQYAAHDVSLVTFEQNRGPCCEPEQQDDPACMNIAMKEDDPYYSNYNTTCLFFQRAKVCASCGTGKRELQNNQTASLDASITYGSLESYMREVRAFDGSGKLKSDDTPEGELLPRGLIPGDLFCPERLSQECFKAGDVRGNQHALLTSMQTLFMREHNRVAAILKELNPQWSEEKLFQEARKIVIGELQSIVYHHYLPLLLGHKMMNRYHLTVKKDTSGTKFNPRLTLGTRIEFTGAVFRLHSMVASNIGVSDLPFRDTYTRSEYLRDGMMPDLMDGVCKAASARFSRHFTKDTTDHLYQIAGAPFGQDLAATDIQRGRDIGIPPYVDVVNYCSKEKRNYTTFDHLSDVISAENLDLLRENYKRVEDVDLWVGMQLEEPSPGSQLGPVASCIVGEQFHNYKYADRFYWEHEGETSSFTYAQRQTLLKSSVSRLLCDNVPEITQVSKNSFIQPSHQNPVVSCEEIPEIDLLLWKSWFP